MIRYHCPICGEPTNEVIVSTLWHFRPIQSPKVWWDFVTGTYRNFGVIAVVTLVSPLLNTIIHWKYRRDRLDIAGQQ